MRHRPHIHFSCLISLVCMGLIWLLPPLASAQNNIPNTPHPKATLEKIRLVTSPQCPTDQIRIEEMFRVTELDPADMLLVRTNSRQEITRTPVQWMDATGLIVHAYCARPDYQESIETRFLSVQGISTPPVIYPVSAPAGKIETQPTPLLGLQQTTRYMQFADQTGPTTKSTCCWHYAYIDFPWEHTEPFETILIPFQFNTVPDANSHLFFQFYSAINTINFYFGWQTHLKVKDKDYGPGFIFSRWDTQNPLDLQTAPDGLFEIGDYEGQFVSVRKPMNLAPGPVILQLTARPDPHDETGHVWVDLSVIHQTGQNKRQDKIGCLRFPSQQAQLTRPLKITVESYSLGHGQPANTWTVPAFDWFINTPQINNTPLTTTPSVTFPDKAPKIVQVITYPNGVQLRRHGLVNLDRQVNP